MSDAKAWKQRAMDAEAELHAIDQVLARRPALDDLTTRYDKVCRACEAAARMDRELSGLAHQLRVEREIGARLLLVLDVAKRMAANVEDFVRLADKSANFLPSSAPDLRPEIGGFPLSITEIRKEIGDSLLLIARKFAAEADAVAEQHKSATKANNGKA